MAGTFVRDASITGPRRVKENRPSGRNPLGEVLRQEDRLDRIEEGPEEIEGPFLEALGDLLGESL